MPTIIDTHTHLYDLPDADAALRDSAAAGVSDVVALGVDLASNQRHLEIARRGQACLARLPSDNAGRTGPAPTQSLVHVALGLHPGNITTPADTDACFAFMREHVREAVAIGETGLDFWYKWVRKDDEKKREQREVFDRHLSLARECGLPVVIHARGAWRECLDRTRQAGITRAEFHWYSGPVDVLKDILDAGFLISCTPALAFSPELRKAVEFAPLDRIMVETDTPVGYSVGTPGTGVSKIPSTPKDVWTTLKLLSEVKGVEQEAVLAAVNANARAFFNLPTSGKWGGCSPVKLLQS